MHDLAEALSGRRVIPLEGGPLSPPVRLSAEGEKFQQPGGLRTDGPSGRTEALPGVDNAGVRSDEVAQGGGEDAVQVRRDVDLDHARSYGVGESGVRHPRGAVQHQRYRYGFRDLPDQLE